MSGKAPNYVFRLDVSSEQNSIGKSHCAKAIKIFTSGSVDGQKEKVYARSSFFSYQALNGILRHYPSPPVRSFRNLVGFNAGIVP